MRDAAPKPDRDHPQAEGAPSCPFCGSDQTELNSLFGSTSLTSQYHCRACRSSFERVKWGTLPPAGGGGACRK